MTFTDKELLDILKKAQLVANERLVELETRCSTLEGHLLTLMADYAERKTDAQS